MSTSKKTLVVILLYMVLFISYTVAATTGTLVLRGYVPERPSVEVASESKREVVELADESGIALVGTIKENTTASKGYTVEISSANAQNSAAGRAYLAGREAGEDVEYQILYGGEMVRLQGGSARLTGLSDESFTDSSQRDLAVAYSSVTPGGSYSDTLTLSVAAN